MYSFTDVSAKLLQGLASVETLNEVDFEKVDVIRNLLTSSMSAEFFFIGLLSDFSLKYHGKLTSDSQNR